MDQAPCPYIRDDALDIQVQAAMHCMAGDKAPGPNLFCLAGDIPDAAEANLCKRFPWIAFYGSGNQSFVLQFSGQPAKNIVGLVLGIWGRRLSWSLPSPFSNVGIQPANPVAIGFISHYRDR